MRCWAETTRLAEQGRGGQGCNARAGRGRGAMAWRAHRKFSQTCRAEADPTRPAYSSFPRFAFIIFQKRAPAGHCTRLMMATRLGFGMEPDRLLRQTRPPQPCFAASKYFICQLMKYCTTVVDIDIWIHLIRRTSKSSRRTQAGPTVQLSPGRAPGNATVVLHYGPIFALGLV